MEGFVHKLKLLIKRQGYGRAGFDLLKVRMHRFTKKTTEPKVFGEVSSRHQDEHARPRSWFHRTVRLLRSDEVPREPQHP